MGVSTRSGVSTEEVLTGEGGDGESVQSRFAKMEDKLQHMIAEQNRRMEVHLSEMFEAFRLQTSHPTHPLDKSGPVSSFSHGNHSGGSDPYKDNRSGSDPYRDVRSGHQQQYGGMTRLGKVDFPRFDGSGIKEWIFKAEEFFGIDYTPDDMKVRTAAVHFDGHASTWHHSFIQTGVGLEVLYDWKSYIKLLKERFEDICEDPIAELKRLQETDGIVSYHEKFELIKIKLNLSQEYLVSAYLAGLRIDTQMHVRMFQPQTISHCFLLGKLYERAHPKPSVQNWSANKGVTQVVHKGVLPTPKEYESKGANQGSNRPFAKPMITPKKFLSQAEMSDRRARGLCYWCDEKFTPEHYLTHKKTQLFSMEVDEEDVFMDAMDQHEVGDAVGQVNPQVSLNAVSGISDYKTMRVKGMFGKRAIFVLIDSGSTHNFVDPKVAVTLGCQIEASRLTKVTVADGRKLDIQGQIKGFTWNFQSTTFHTDVMLIPLQGCDMVLGVQWLEKLGRISWEFKKLEMGFLWEGKKVLLHGIRNGSVRAVKAQKLNKLQEDQVQFAMLSIKEENIRLEEVQECGINKLEIEDIEPQEIKKILCEYKDIFEEPIELPPFRKHHDHKIQLKEGSNPVNQRPYRYSIHQKNEIDKIVEDMLVSGTVQNSSSSYASPVVLVKKKDGSWRLCVDYRELNGMTVKDRFPIPLIEDLMDELGGLIIYFKIDLRAGYHQLRMNEADIHKTAFKTHSGHYEYLVMPFGLTNAPATFQGWMNAVFKKFLRNFVLIFFDDILVYSKSLEEHVVHLQLVFEAMRQNKLFAKWSKCEFAVQKVEYLGHFISGSGISTDPAKINAVKEWPTPNSLKQLRGFLSLAGYYRRFVQNFGTIASPLHALTKKDSFLWSAEAQMAFDRLKEAMCNTPVLALPLFDKTFVVETDACGHGIGAVLMQEGHPVAYISRQLKGKQLNLSIYEKELLAVIFAVNKWRHYLLPEHFIIKTDQRSLKYLLEQRLNTPIQQQWLLKLLEFDYEIQYKHGKENLVADALSRVEGSEVLHMAMSVVECDLLKVIQEGYEKDA